MRSPPSGLVRGVRTAVAVAVLSGVWLVFLPHWSMEPRMRAALRVHEEHGINGSATFYTENPAAIHALQDIRQLEREQPTLLWSPFDGIDSMP